MDRNPAVSRRDLLKAGTAAAALAASASVSRAAEQAAASEPAAASAPASQSAGPLPTRVLGKTGEKVTVINQGCGGEISQRLLDHAYAMGVRYFDTAGGYANGRSEQEIAKWFDRTGKRKDIFLVTKTHPQKDNVGDLNLMLKNVDIRLRALKTDYIDLFFVHGMGNKEYGEEGLGWPKSEQFKEVAQKLKDSGKVRFVGFSCHDTKAPELLTAAAEGGFLDAIMMSYNLVLGRAENKLNKALDACHNAGIGLIAMKSMRGIGDQLKRKVPEGGSLARAVIHAVLSDERISTICSAMSSLAQIDENTAAARSFTQPLAEADRERLHGALLAAGRDFCPGCDACRSGIAATHPHVHDITRYLSYFEQDGRRAQARQLFRALPTEAMDAPADALAAAREACTFHVDYPALLKRAAQKLA
jgi:predicted aldo/keto reductase-like oxidoreductase